MRTETTINAPEDFGVKEGLGESGSFEKPGRTLRKHVASLLGMNLAEYTPGKMTYDLRRLRLKGLILRKPGSNRYTVTTYGLKVAFFYTKVYLRILRPGWASLEEDGVPHLLRRALQKLETEVERVCDDARLRPAA